MLYKIVFGKEIHLYQPPKDSGFEDLVEYVRKSFKKNSQNFSMSYVDQENDRVTLSTQKDLEVLQNDLKDQKNKITKIYIENVEPIQLIQKDSSSKTLQKREVQRPLGIQSRDLSIDAEEISLSQVEELAEEKPLKTVQKSKPIEVQMRSYNKRELQNKKIPENLVLELQKIVKLKGKKPSIEAQAALKIQKVWRGKMARKAKRQIRVKSKYEEFLDEILFSDSKIELNDKNDFEIQFFEKQAVCEPKRFQSESVSQKLKIPVKPNYEQFFDVVDRKESKIQQKMEMGFQKLKERAEEKEFQRQLEKALKISRLSAPPQHETKCDECLRYPIQGIRYKCSVCPDYDVCENCEKSSEHVHPFLKIKNLQQTPLSINVVLNQNEKKEAIVKKGVKSSLSQSEVQENVLKASYVSQFSQKNFHDCYNILIHQPDLSKEELVQIMLDMN